MFRKICSVAMAAALVTSAHPALAATPVVSAQSVPDPAKIELPNLSAPTGSEDAADFDKYFYFHRPETSFEQALSDIRECDGYARGLASPFGYQEAGHPYAGTLAGVAGGAIANLMISAIFGSAELRKARRTNMRRCMNYKGYERYGLPKDIWQEFHFEEGLRKVDEDDRQLMLAKQAKAASMIPPAGKGLGR